MKSISDLDSEECLIIFKRLKRSERQQALSPFIPDGEFVQVYIPEQLFKDVIHILSKHIDLQTWGKLRQVCKLFNRQLKSYPCTDKFVLFFPRVKWLCLWIKEIYPDFDMGIYKNEVLSLKTRLHARKNRNSSSDIDWFHVLRIFKIAYPYGFITSGDNKARANLFDPDIRNLMCLTKYGNFDLKTYDQMTKEERLKFKKYRADFEELKKELKTNGGFNYLQ
jgi:hypothetical protein